MKKEFEWPIIGHDNIKKYLEQTVNAGKLSHAYIFAGPAHLGKKTLAISFIKSFLCSADKVPCGRCEFCRSFKKGIYPDFYEILPIEGKKNIGIEQIRELRDLIGSSSFSGNYKVILINKAENMTLAAANSLLKILEEPSKKTIFILLANDIQGIPPTIRSRSQIINFSPVASEKIENYLKKTGANKEHIREAAGLAQGRPGLAISLIENNRLLQGHKELVSDFLNFLNSSVGERFNYIEKSIGKQKSFQEKIIIAEALLSVWMNVFRDLLLAKLSLKERLSNVAANDRLEIMGGKYSDKKIIYFLDKIKEAENNLASSINPQLVAENLALIF